MLISYAIANSQPFVCFALHFQSIVNPKSIHPLFFFCMCLFGVATTSTSTTQTFFLLLFFFGYLQIKTPKCECSTFCLISFLYVLFSLLFVPVKMKKKKETQLRRILTRDLCTCPHYNNPIDNVTLFFYRLLLANFIILLVFSTGMLLFLKAVHFYFLFVLFFFFLLFVPLSLSLTLCFSVHSRSQFYVYFSVNYQFLSGRYNWNQIWKKKQIYARSKTNEK